MESFPTIIEFFSCLPAETLSRLYSHGPVCLSVLHELSLSARNCLMRLLFVETVVGRRTVESWSDHYAAAVDQLCRLRILELVQLDRLSAGLKVNSTFQKSLSDCLFAVDRPSCVDGPAASSRKGVKDDQFLVNYANGRWTHLLEFIVDGGRKGLGVDVSQLTKDVLVSNRLLGYDDTTKQLAISPLGFKFLLSGLSVQVWQIVRMYLDHYRAQVNGENALIDCVELVMRIAYGRAGQLFETGTLTVIQTAFLRTLRELGLVYQKKSTAVVFQSTFLAGLVVSSDGLHSESNLSVGGSSSGYLIVETNYRVYAMTESPLKIGLMALFSELLYRFPNMAVGLITRASVRRALSKGITAEQIINFLRTNADGRMAGRQPVVPPTLVDQLRLWEMERARFQVSSGVLYEFLGGKISFDSLSLLFNF